jgi:hypothetical protein
MPTKKFISFNDDSGSNKSGNTVVVVQNSTADNVKVILLYALALAAALAFNDFIRSVFIKLNIYQGSQIGSKFLYVLVMFGAVLTLAYFTKSKINI